MAKAKSDHPLVGKIFICDKQTYRVQDVQQQIVCASKMIDDKTCQRGRPSKFELNQVMSLLGVTTASLATEAATVAAAKAASKMRPKPEKIEEPPIPTPAAPLSDAELEARKKSLANLIAMFPPDDLNTDW